jgi:aminopeptidase N
MQEGGFDLLHYELWLDLTEATKTDALRAVVKITLKSLQDDLRQVRLDAKDLSIESIEGAERFTLQEDTLDILLKAPLSYQQEVSLLIRYQLRPSAGFKVFERAVYTAFHTYQWMPCIFSPDERATFTLHLTTPAGWSVAGNGEQTTMGNTHHLSLLQQYPAYVLGFAAGDFWRASRQLGSTTLTLLATQSTPKEAERFLDTIERAMKFFEDKSGVPYSGTHYTMVLAPGEAFQELANLSIIGEKSALDFLQDEREDWAPVHELAHQWWGNRATCAHWGEFWLNEGFAVFMTAAYKEQRWGLEAYQREEALAEKRYEKLKTQGKDRPLVLPKETTFRQAGGSIVYTKGALVLFGARVLVGEEAFWRAIRAFTQNGVKEATTTAKLQEVFAKYSAQSLSSLRW